MTLSRIRIDTAFVRSLKGLVVAALLALTHASAQAHCSPEPVLTSALKSARLESFAAVERASSEIVRVTNWRVGEKSSSTENRASGNSNQAYAQLVEEVAGSNRTLYTRGDTLISQTRSGARSYYHGDALNSTKLLTDELGGVTDSYPYEAFGNLASHVGSSANNFLFTGEQLDPATEFYNLRARWMDPSVGRFARFDTFEGSQLDPPSLHKYLYAHDDPTNRIDPSGLFTLGEVGAALNSSITLATNAISTYNFVFGNPDSDAVDGIPSIWDLVMSFAVRSAASQLDFGTVAAVGAAALSLGGTDKHHVIPVYCCGHPSQRLVTLARSDHVRIHRELNRFATLINVAGKGVDLLVYKRPTSVFRKTPLQRLGRTSAGRGAILAGLQAFYAADGSLGSGLPPIQSALVIEGPRFIGSHHSVPRGCRR